MDTLLKLENALYNKYYKENAYIETTKDYLAITCYSYMYDYVERYFDWLVKFLKRYNYIGFIYIFGYSIEIK